MAETPRNQPNRLLAWQRLQRGWSYEELARRIRYEMLRVEEPDTGLTANTVRRWETGERFPEPRYRKHLVELFGKPASQLGLLTPDELAMCPAEEAFQEIGRLLGMMEEASGEGIDRTAFLRQMLGVGAVPMFASLLSQDSDPHAWSCLGNVLEGRRPLDEESVRTYADICARQRTLYWTSPAASLFEMAYAHTQLGVRLLRGISGGGVRDQLARATGESALLAARLAFFDLHEAAVAQRLFDLAATATRECGDHPLAAAVLAHAAFVPGFAGDHDTAIAFLNAARAHAGHGVGPLTRSWLYCVRSEIEARAGNKQQCRREIGRAEQALSGSGEDPSWLDFYDSTRLDGFAGYSALIVGDRAMASNRLSAALDMLGERDIKQRPVLLADLANTTDDREQREALLHQALDALEHHWYATGYDRVHGAVAVLGDQAQASGLHERIRALSPPHTPRALSN